MRTGVRLLVLLAALALSFVVSLVLDRLGVRGPVGAIVMLLLLVSAIFVSRRLVARLSPGPAPPPSRVGRFAGVAVLVVLIGYPVYCTYTPGRGVRPGMTRDQAIAAVGRPPMREEHGTFAGCKEPPGWRGDCAGLKASGSVDFLVWKTGIDTVLVIGLDASGKVAFRDWGAT